MFQYIVYLFIWFEITCRRFLTKSRASKSLPKMLQILVSIRYILRAGIVPPLKINALWSLSIKSYLSIDTLLQMTLQNDLYTILRLFNLIKHFIKFVWFPYPLEKKFWEKLFIFLPTHQQKTQKNTGNEDIFSFRLMIWCWYLLQV